MPITLLHVGLMAPTLLAAKPKPQTWWAVVSFTLVNLWIDMGAIHAWAHNLPLPSHDEPWHTLQGALVTALFISMLGIIYWRWVVGAYYGAVSHILVDGMVHPEMDSPLYFGGMELVSLALVLPTVWVIVQIVSGVLSYVRRSREPQFESSEWQGYEEH